MVRLNPPASSADIAAVVDELKGLQSTIETEEQARTEDARHIRFVHARSLLRAAPERQGQLIRYVYPDQRLRIVGEQGDWLKAEVFDYQSDAVTTGWIYRANVRLTPSDTTFGG